MKSEKVKEIKKALEDNKTDHLPYIDGWKCKFVEYADILTLINELESENYNLKEVNGALESDLINANGNLIHLEIEVSDYQDKMIELNSEIAELKRKIECVNKIDVTLKEIINEK